MRQVVDEQFLPPVFDRRSHLKLQVIDRVPVPRTGINKWNSEREPAFDVQVLLCRRLGCQTALPTRASGAGRPAVYCSPRCRALAGHQREAAKGTRRAARQQPAVRAAARRKTRLGAQLAKAITASPLTLEEISLRLRTDHGIGVSPATISTWTHGRLPRRTAGDQKRIQALEQVLGRPAGELWLLLERDRQDRKAVTRRHAPQASAPQTSRAAGRPAAEEPEVDRLRQRLRELASSDDYVTTAVDELITIGRDRYEHRRRVRLTVRDLGGGRTDCYRLLYTPNPNSDNDKKPPIHREWACRVGRRVQGSKTSGLAAAELLFDRVLDPGTSHTFGYVEEGFRIGTPRRWVRRGVGHSSVDLVKMVVRFETSPAQVFTCQWAQQGQPPTTTVEIDLVDNTATLLLTKPAPGLHGLTWRW